MFEILSRCFGYSLFIIIAEENTVYQWSIPSPEPHSPAHSPKIPSIIAFKTSKVILSFPNLNMSRSYTISTGYVLNSVILHVGCAKSTFICLSGLSSLVTWAILFPISVQSQASYTPSTFIIHSNCSCCALSSPRADRSVSLYKLSFFRKKI